MISATMKHLRITLALALLLACTPAYADFKPAMPRDGSGLTSGEQATFRTAINVPSLSGSYADPAWITALAWSKLTGTPTTLAGYGITDALSLAGGTLWGGLIAPSLSSSGSIGSSAINGAGFYYLGSQAGITPTGVSGVTRFWFNSVAGTLAFQWRDGTNAPKGLAIADGKSLIATNTLTLSGTDGSTLNIGSGGTLGSAAYTAASAYAPATSGTSILKGNGSGGTTAATAGTDFVAPSTTVNGHALSSNVNVTASDVGLGSVPNYPAASQSQANAGTASTLLTSDVGRVAMTLPANYSAQSVGTTYKAENLTWRGGRIITWGGFLDPALIAMDEPWTQGLSISGKTGIPGGANPSASGGVLTVPMSGSSAGWVVNFWPAGGFNQPFIGVGAPIVQMAGTSTTDKIGIGFNGGIGSNDYIYAMYDRLNTKLYLAYAKNGYSEVDTSGVTISYTPYALGLGIADKCATIWTKQTSTSSWDYAYTYYIDPAVSSNPDYRQASYITQFVPAVTGIWSGSSPQAEKFGEVQAGYLQGVGLANLEVATWDDGTPMFDGTELYIVASRPHPSSANGSSDTNVQWWTQVPCSTFCVMGLNVWSGTLRTVSLLSTNNSGVIYGNNSGSCVYDTIGHRFIWVDPNWGMSPYAAQGTQEYMYTTTTWPTGAQVLTGGTMWQLPNYLTRGHYDPCLLKVSGTWTLANTEQIPGTSNYPQICTSSDLSTWTQLAANSSHRTYSEGSKLVYVGGTLRALYGDATSGHVGYYNIYNSSDLSVVGDYAYPFYSTNLPASHPQIVPLPEGGNTRYLLLGFNGTTPHGGSDPNFMEGQIWMAWSNEVNTGHEFELKRLPFK